MGLLLSLQVRQGLAAAGAVGVIPLDGGAAVGAEAGVAALGGVGAVLGVGAEALVEGVGLLVLVHDVVGGVAVVAGGVFEAVNGVDHADADEHQTEEGEEEGGANGRRYAGPDDAEDDPDQGADGVHHGWAPAGLDAFHGDTSWMQK